MDTLASEKDSSLSPFSMEIEEAEEDKSFFFKIDDRVLYEVFDFLDPISLLKFSASCSRMKQFTRAYPLLFKKFCLVFFGNFQESESNYPKNSIFRPLIPKLDQLQIIPSRVRMNPEELLQEFMWGSQPSSSFKTPLSYFKKFGNWEGMFNEALRIRFPGVYLIKESMVKFGERKPEQQHVPVHKVKVFRYIRFFEDGHALYMTKPVLLPMAKLMKEMSIGELRNSEPQHFNSIFTKLRAEWMTKNDYVYLRTFQKQTLYAFNFKMKSSGPGASDQLLPIGMYDISFENGYAADILLKAQRRDCWFVPIPEFKRNLENEKLRAICY